MRTSGKKKTSDRTFIDSSDTTCSCFGSRGTTAVSRSMTRGSSGRVPLTRLVCAAFLVFLDLVVVSGRGGREMRSAQAFVAQDVCVLSSVFGRQSAVGDLRPRRAAGAAHVAASALRPRLRAQVTIRAAYDITVVQEQYYGASCVGLDCPHKRVDCVNQRLIIVVLQVVYSSGNHGCFGLWTDACLTAATISRSTTLLYATFSRRVQTARRCTRQTR